MNYYFILFFFPLETLLLVGPHNIVVVVVAGLRAEAGDHALLRVDHAVAHTAGHLLKLLVQLGHVRLVDVVLVAHALSDGLRRTRASFRAARRAPSRRRTP